MNKLWFLCKGLLIKCFNFSKKNNFNILTIGITANMVGLWPIDKVGKPVRNGILWNDLRTSQLMNKLKTKNKNIYDDKVNHGIINEIIKDQLEFRKQELKSL